MCIYVNSLRNMCVYAAKEIFIYLHHIYLGSWSNLNSNSYRQINEMPGYNEEITEAKKISIEVRTYMHIYTYM
jgi:hypothetical protein